MTTTVRLANGLTGGRLTIVTIDDCGLRIDDDDTDDDEHELDLSLNGYHFKLSVVSLKF